MNQVAVFNAGNLPAHLRKGELSDMAKALAGGGSGEFGKRISVKGCTFRLIVDGKEVTRIDDRYLDVVIVNAAPKITRTFYMAQYDENTPAAPDCWSPDGDTPDKSSKNMQSPTCATCPQNAKGSGNGDSRACRFSQRIAVVLANDQEGDVMQVSLAATSIFGKAVNDDRPLQAYAKYLMEQGIDPGALITRMKFDTSVATPKLFFKPMRWLEEDEYAICQEKGRTPEALKAVTMTVSQMDGIPAGTPAKLSSAPPPAPAPTPAPPPPAPAPAPAPTQPEEPPAPPPKPRAKKTVAAAPAPAPEEPADPVVRTAAPAPTAVPAAAGNLASIITQWDD